MVAPWMPVAAVVSALFFGSRKVSDEPGDGRSSDFGLPASAFQAAPFPPLSIDEEWERIIRVSEITERAAKIPGLKDFLIAASYTESRGIPGAINDTGDDAKRALSLLCDYPVNYGKRFRDNPWRPEPCRDSALSRRWAYTGGPWGLMPVSALSTYDKVGRDMDPARVFDVEFAAAFTADIVYRLRRRWGAVNWDRARAGMKTHTLASVPFSHPVRRQVHARFKEAIRETRKYGVDQSLDKRGVNVKRYPGFAAVLRAVLEAQGRVKDEDKPKEA